MSRIDLQDVTDVAEIGVVLANLLAQAAISYGQWNALAEAAKAEGRSDFSKEELDTIHAAMQASTDRFLARDFTSGDPPDPT